MNHVPIALAIGQLFICLTLLAAALIPLWWTSTGRHHSFVHKATHRRPLSSHLHPGPAWRTATGDLK